MTFFLCSLNQLFTEIRNWIYKMSLEKLFWIRKIDLVMTELAEDQGSGFSNEEGLGGWRRNTDR